MVNVSVVVGIKKALLGFLFLGLAVGFSFGQETVVRGKVTDAKTGDPIPFANVIFKGTPQGTTTNFDGQYVLRSHQPTDSIVISYIGYKSRTRAVRPGTAQTVNIQLEEDIVSLQAVVIQAGENPAYAILRQVLKNRERNDKRKLSAYEYDTYTKIEIDVDNISDALRQRKMMRKITSVLDSVDRIAGEDGKPILPLFITESVSKVYYRDKPSLKKEVLLKTKVSGVGVEDGSTVSQLVGSSFQEYNFYQNWLTIVTKDFVSPLADVWRLYYDYDLTDSVWVGNDFCYRLDFFPRSPQDLAFTGTMWITREDFALKQIDATVGGQANLNFIEKIRIQQELARTQSGAWLPAKNRVLIDVGELTKRSAGMLAKFYTSNQNWVVDKVYPPAFYERPIEMREEALLPEDEQFWDSLRHEPLSETEKNVYRMIDTLKNIPVVKTYTDIIKIVLDGYVKSGKVEFGPYLSAVAWNNVEGFRVQTGFRTNYQFSKRWILAGQLGYGFNDHQIKHSVSLQHILSRDRWTTFSIRHRYDLGRLGVNDEDLADNPLFLTATRWGYFRRGFYFDETRAVLQRELFRGFSQRLIFKYMTFDPEYEFGFFENTVVRDRFQTAEISIESRFARDELFIQNGNDRISLGTSRWPVITLRYTRGFEGVFGSDFSYDKLRLSVVKRMKTGPLGVAYLTLQGEYVFNPLPYPLLTLHLGNQSFLYSSVTYKLMNFGEFVSDQYASLQYRQYFEGFLLNRVPVLKRLNWRLLGTANVIVGGMRPSNRALISQMTPEGAPTLRAGYLTGTPYIELGYGVENIFRFLRVDFVHRLTYLENTDARRFGILFTAQFQL